MPNLLRVLDPRPSETILDIACGQGFFSREIAKTGAKVVACDIAKELIDLARKHQDQGKDKNIDYHVSAANVLGFCPSGSINAAIIVLALQNIEDISGVFHECAKVLKSSGPSGLGSRLIIVLNHPAFRIPKHSSWQWDEPAHAQYRRVDAYMSDTRERIDMNPGTTLSPSHDQKDNMSKKDKNFTVSFHRPMQVYFKALAKAGFVVTHLEEWISHKQSDAGPRAKEEDRIRKEIPMFLMIEAGRV
jgi:ubiquinone/menaquinone biosynthesis C-methylase UbiE